LDTVTVALEHESDIPQDHGKSSTDSGHGNGKNAEGGLPSILGELPADQSTESTTPARGTGHQMPPGDRDNEGNTAPPVTEMLATSDTALVLTAYPQQSASPGAPAPNLAGANSPFDVHQPTTLSQVVNPTGPFATEVPPSAPTWPLSGGKDGSFLPLGARAEVLLDTMPAIMAGEQLSDAERMLILENGGELTGVLMPLASELGTSAFSELVGDMAITSSLLIGAAPGATGLSQKGIQVAPVATPLLSDGPGGVKTGIEGIMAEGAEVRELLIDPRRLQMPLGQIANASSWRGGAETCQGDDLAPRWTLRFALSVLAGAVGIPAFVLRFHKVMRTHMSSTGKAKRPYLPGW
jgi:hypothetical protein